MTRNSLETRKRLQLDSAKIGPFLTVEEVAASLSCSKSAVYRWVSEGKLKPVRAGSLLRFTPKAIDAFLQAE